MFRSFRCITFLLVFLFAFAVTASEQEWKRHISEGGGYFKRADYPAALKSFKYAVKLSEGFGNKDARHATGLNNIGVVLRKMGRFNEAIPYYQKALSIRESVLGENHPLVSSTVNNIALLKKELGEYTQAEPLYRRAIAIMESNYGADDERLATSLNNLAGLYVEMGRYKEAKSLYRRALTIREKKLGKDHVDTALSQSNLAGLFQQLGDYSSAEKLYKNALITDKKKLGAEHPVVAFDIQNLANLYQAQGRLDEADSLYEQALSIAKKRLGEKHPKVVSLKSNQASLYLEQERFKAASELMLEVLETRRALYGDNHMKVASVYNNLGSLYEKQGLYDKAAKYYLSALEINIKKLGQRNAKVAATMSNIGVVLNKARQPMAEKFFVEAVAVWREIYGDSHPALAVDLRSLAILYAEQGKYEKGLEYAREATQIYQRRAAYAAEALSTGGDSERVSQRNAYAIHVYLLYKHIQEKPAQKDKLLNEAFEISQLASGLGAAEAVSQMAVRFAANDNKLAEVVRIKQDKIRQWQTLDANLIEAASKASKQSIARIQKKITQLEADLDEINQELHQRYPKYEALVSPKPVSLSSVQSVLGNDEAMINYFLGPNDGFVWVIRKNNSDFFRVDTTFTEVATLVKAIRFKVDPLRSLDRYDPVLVDQLHDLYKLLFKPATQSLSEASHIMIVPDGPLQSMPFAMLAMASSAIKDYRQVKWLFQQYTTTTLPSVGSLKSLREFARASRAKKSFIGFGDPVLDGASSSSSQSVNVASLYDNRALAMVENVKLLEPLPETADELMLLAKSLHASNDDLFLADDATEEVVKSRDLRQYKTLAFATHGLMSGDFSGLTEPALVMTPPDTPSRNNDGLLTASEITQLSLDADLVLLSACNTAAEDGSPGAEGFSGLTKAFFYAGSRALMVSHWAVASDATVSLTTGMFNYKSKNPSAGVARALSESMRRYIKQASSSATAHPMYWAPFVIVGEGNRPVLKR